MSKWRPSLPLLSFVLALSTAPAGVSAQSVRGEVIDTESQKPLEGSVVAVLDRDGNTLVTLITSAEGRFVARLRDPGTITLRVDRIGYESTVTEPFEVGRGQDVFRRIEIGVVPVSLEGIEVSSGRSCVVRPGPDALATARVWEQARTALAATATTQLQKTLRFDIELYVRQLDARSLTVTDEQRTERRASPLIPFGSRDSEDLAEHGYIQTFDLGRYYDFFAPTADVLLSDPFLDTHCFRLAEGEGENDGLIGLRFEPVRRRDVPDVAGTLWLDRATASLRHAEMHYVSRDADVPTEGALARVEFTPLPGGRWIVDRWFIRMPRMVERRMPGAYAGSRTVRSVGSFREEGGEVTRIVDSDGMPILAAGRFAARGVVYDSMRGQPIRSARVSLAGTAHRALTDDTGRFTFVDVPPGRYTVRVDHARLDSLPEFARPRGEIVIGRGEPAEVELATPMLRNVIDAVCPGLWMAVPGSALPGVPYPVQGDALITGIVVDEEGQPVTGAEVDVSWEAFAITDRFVNVRNVIPSSTTREDGRFTICGIPSDMPLSVRAVLGDAKSDVVAARANGRFAHATLIVK